MSPGLWRAIDLTIREVVPRMLEDLELTDKADRLRALPAMTDEASLQSNKSAATGILEYDQHGHRDFGGMLASGVRLRRYAASHLGATVLDIIESAPSDEEAFLKRFCELHDHLRRAAGTYLERRDRAVFVTRDVATVRGQALLARAAAEVGDQAMLATLKGSDAHDLA